MGKRKLSRTHRAPPPEALSPPKLERSPTEVEVKKHGKPYQNHPCFFGASATAEQLEAVKRIMHPLPTESLPSFHGINPAGATHKRSFPTIIDPRMVGAAESFAEENHPLYADVAASLAQRMPHSVCMNMVAGI